MSKGPDAFRTISEVAEDLDLPQHVLRFWETRFSQIKPLKRGGGRRYYRPDDIDLLRGIRHLLYEEGYTIRGLQRILKEQGNAFVIAVGKGEVEQGAVPEDLPATTAIGLVSHAREEAGADTVGEEDADAKPARGKKAVPVSELTGAKSKGILGRLRGREGEGQASGGRDLSAENRRDLQATLYELLECKRLLDQVRG